MAGFYCNGTDINIPVCLQVCILITFLQLHKWYKAGMWGSKQDSLLAFCIHKATITNVSDQEGCPCFLFNHFIYLGRKQFMKINH